MVNSGHESILSASVFECQTSSFATIGYSGFIASSMDWVHLPDLLPFTSVIQHDSSCSSFANLFMFKQTLLLSYYDYYSIVS
mgnify:CR=1 FL=1